MEGSCERGKGPSPWESPSPAGRSGRTDRELQRLRGECSSWLTADRAERDEHRHSWPPPRTPEPKTHVRWYMWEPGAEGRASDDRPRERTGVGHAERAQRDRSVVWPHWECVQNRARFHHRSPVVNAQVKGGAGPPLGPLGATSTSGLPTRKSRAEI